MEKEQFKFNKRYRTLEKIHYGTEKEFPSYEERVSFLKRYAFEAERVYEEYKNNPEAIKNEEDRKKFEEYSVYKEFGSDLILTEIFREKVKKACRIASLIKEAEKEKLPAEKLNALRVRFAVAKAEVNKMINSLGPLLEYAHRKTLEKEKNYYEFRRLNKERAELKVLAEIPLGEVATAHEMFEKKMQKEKIKEDQVKRKLIKIAQARDYLREDEITKILDDPEISAELEKLSQETGEDLVGFAEELIKKKEEEKIYFSKEKLNEKLKEIDQKLESLWQDDIVRYLYYQNYLENLITQDQFGEPALEIPSLIKLMNEISAWERRHTETPIGAVLIGPPGTGKSLGIEHYLAIHPEHKKKGPPVIIDMSQETTEFILLGGEAIELTDKAEIVKMLAGLFDQEDKIEEKLKNEELSKEEKENLLLEQRRLEKKIEDLIHACQAQYVEFRKMSEQIEESEVDKLAEECIQELIEETEKQKLSPRIRERIKKSIQNALTTWQAQELGKIMYGNGWRDGIILKALKEGRDIIINEYNNFRIPPDALRQLFQTAYGGKWFFAGTGKEYPVYSRIYLTANEGSSTEKFFYDTAQVTAAFASRLPPPIEVKLPSLEEEILIVQAKLSDTNKKFLLDKELKVKLQATGALKDYEFSLKYNEKELINYLFRKVLPQLRALVLKAPKDVPSLDLRHINRFCRDLVSQSTRERTQVSIEEAFIKNFCYPFMSNPTAWEVFCQSGIVEEMYQKGLLHQGPGTEVHSFLIKVLAKKEGEELEYVSEEAKKNILTRIEEKLQKYDAELIENLKQIKGEEKWSEIINKAKERKVVILNPYLKETLPISFSKYFPIPEEKAF